MPSESKEHDASSLTLVATLSPPLLTLGGNAAASGTTGSQAAADATNDDAASPQDATPLSYGDTSPAWQTSFSLDGSYLVVAVGAPSSCVRVYHNAYYAKRNVNTDRNEWILQATLKNSDTKNPRTVRSVAVAPLRTLNKVHSTLIVASASFDGSISIWEYSDSYKNNSKMEEVCSSSHDHDHHDHNCNHDHHDSLNNGWICTTQLEGHESEVKCVCWNATASLLASCGRDKSVWIWECSLSNNVNNAISNSNSNSSDWECLAVLSGHEADVKCLQFCPSHDLWGDGDEILLSGSYDDTVKLWAEDAGEWYLVASIANVHSSTIWSLAVAPSGTRFVSGSADGSLAIYKAYTGSEYRRKFPSDNAMDVPSHRNGVWKCVGQLNDAHSEPVYSVSYAPARCGHGRIASGGGDGRINVYRETMQSTADEPSFVLDVSVVTKHGDVNHVCWHPWDGSLLASVGDDGSVQLWKYTSS